MKVGEVTVSRFIIPLPHSMCDSMHGEIDSFTLVTVRIRTRDGQEGVGFTYTVGTAGGAAIASLISEDLAPILIDRDPRCITSLWEEMWGGTLYVGRGGSASFAISAVDIALWDLKARNLDEPLWRLLGGGDPRVQAYASGIDLNLTLDELEEQVRRNLSQGFKAIKMKVGKQRLSEDIMRVAAIRELLGPERPLMVDANTKWGVEESIRASRALAEYDVYWLEEPTVPSDVKGHARIQTEGALPIALGENLRTLREFEAMISAGSVAFPEPDATNCGGVTGWLKVAHLAEARNLPVTSHGAQDLHVSLLAAVPNASFLEIHSFMLDSYLVNRLDVLGGRAEASERPGHGMDFRWKELMPYVAE